MMSRTLIAASTRPIILAILSRIQKVKAFSRGNIPILQRMEVDALISSKWTMSVVFAI